MRKKVLLICEVCLSRNYNTTVNKATQTERFQIKKYCPKCNKMTLHKESRQEIKMGLKKYTGEVIKEAKRVRWPKREILFNTLIVVLVVVFLAASILFIEDVAVGKLLGEIERVFEGFKKQEGQWKKIKKN